METEKKESNLSSENETGKDDSASWYWASAVAEGVPPSARGGHTSTLVGSSLVIFGGHFYKDKNVKAVVIACNTSSSAAYNYIKDAKSINNDITQYGNETLAGTIINKAALGAKAICWIVPSASSLKVSV